MADRTHPPRPPAVDRPFLNQTISELKATDIPSLCATIADLRRSEELYRALFMDSPIPGQSLDGRGYFLEVNQAFLDLLGYRRDEIIGSHFTVILHPAWTAHFNVYYPRLQAIGEVLGSEFELRRKDQTSLLVSFLGRIIRDPRGGFLRSQCVFVDITEKHRMEEALRQRNSQLQSIFRAAPIGIGVVSDRVICQVNARLCQMTGYEQKELLHRNSRMLYPAEDDYLAVGREKYAQISRNGTGTVETRWQRKDGTVLDVLLSSAPFDPDDLSLGVTFTALDITDRIRAEADIKAINEDLERRVEKRTLELQQTRNQFLHAEKLSAIGRLSASIAHEFNNPLQGVMSILRGIQKRAVFDEEDAQLVTAAIGECERMRNLIRNLQEFNRPSSGQKTLVELHQAIDAVLLLHRFDLRKRRIAVVRKFALRLSQIEAVPDQIKQVFLNLFTNAADACQERGGTITITTRQGQDHVIVRIADTGVGIRPEDRERIFEPFFTTKPEVKGTGLGLPVCYGIVKQHHGEIRVKSTLGKGTAVTLFLPIQGSRGQGEHLP